MEKILKAIGAQVRKARLAKGMSQVQLAEALNISPPHVSNIETGKNAMNVTTLYQLCELLAVSADWIVRNNTPNGRKYTPEEFEHIFTDFTPAESAALLNILQYAKLQIRDVQHADNSDT